MFWKKIFFLTAWYVAWSIVGSLYKWKKKILSWSKKAPSVKELSENFIEIQKNFISDIEKKFLSSEAKEKLAERKESFQNYAQDYLRQWEKLLKDIQANELYQDTQKKWLSFFQNLKLKAQSLYNQALEEEEKLKASAKDTLEDGVSRVKRAKDELTKKK